MKLILFLLLPFLLFSQTTESHSELPPAFKLFHNFGNNILSSFSNSYGLYHLSAITVSYGLVEGNVDWKYYQFMRNNKNIGYAGFPAVILGGIVPVTVPLYLYFKSVSDNDRQMMFTAYALCQAALISYLSTSFYKSITGRDGPDIFDDNGTRTDYSKSFHFGLFENGIFDGWPSGHTTTAFAMAVTLMELYPDNSTIQTAAWIYASFIGIGISTNIHWFSDFVAGTLVGYSIGKTVGKSFRILMGEKTSENNLSIQPTLNGININFNF